MEIYQRFRLWHFCVVVSLWPFIGQSAYGVHIVSSSLSPLHVAVGDSVSLRCHFNLAFEDVGMLDIEWSIKPPDNQQEETLVIWYAGHHIYDNYDPFKGRVQFMSPDPSSGNASITITDLKLTESGTYRCKVKKTPGIDSTNIHLNVMERPSKPACYLEGVVEMDKNVVLRCKSTQGSPNLWYRWSKLSTDKMLPRDATFDPVQGNLCLTISTEAVLGTYVCSAANLVGVETCTLTLRLTSPVNKVATSAAATVTVLVVIIIVTAIIVLRCRRRKNLEYLGHEILVDEPPPYKFLSRESNQVVSSSGNVQDRVQGRYKNVMGKREEQESVGMAAIKELPYVEMAATKELPYVEMAAIKECLYEDMFAMH